MSRYGALTLPVPEVEDDVPISDPALGILLEFLTAVINFAIGDAWKSVAPADDVPVVKAFAEDPDLENLDVQVLPALFGWRPGSKDPRGMYSQDLIADTTGFHFLWVPPPAVREDSRVRQPIRNGIKKAVQEALARKRHKAWKVPGDTYFRAQTEGSVLLRHLRASLVNLDEFRPHLLKIGVTEGGNGRENQQFDCLFMAVDCLELMQPGAGDVGVPHIANQGTIKLGSDPEDLLAVQTYDLATTITSVSPSSGTDAGGTTVTLTGTQFFPTMTVLFDGEPATGLTVVDDNTVTVVTPERSAGAGLVAITVQGAGRPDVVVDDAFTYV